MAGMMEFGRLVKTAREQRGLTGMELANRLGRPHPFVVRIETGKNANPPDPQTFDDLARVLGISKRRMLEALGYLDAVELTAKPETLTLPADDPRAELVTLLDGYPPAALAVIVATVREIAPPIRRTMTARSDSGTGA